MHIISRTLQDKSEVTPSLYPSCLNIKWIIVFYIFLCFTLTPAADAQETPDRDELFEALRAKLPNYVEPLEMILEVSENVGNKVEPRVISRIRASIRLKENIYIPTDRKMAGRSIIQMYASENYKDFAYFISDSIYYQGRWRTTFRPQGEPFYSRGAPRATFASDAVVEGSTEEQLLLEAQRRQDEERLRLVEKAKELGEKIISYSYSGYDPDFCNNTPCANAKVDVYGSWLKVDYCCRRRYVAQVWFGDIIKYSFSPVHYPNTIGRLSVSYMASSIYSDLEIYFNKHEDYKNFQRQFTEKHAGWRKAFCPVTQALTCSKLKQR